MSFTTSQIGELTNPLESKHVKSRNQGNRQVSYIEGWHAIAEANRIFGFDMWDRETMELRQLHEPMQDNKNLWRVGYMARVRVTVWHRTGSGDIETTKRDGCGYGSGIARDLGDAHESAIKEAETDAMKRALMTFGNPFGLALYDKTQANVSSNADQGRAGDHSRPVQPDPPAEATLRATENRLAKAGGAGQGAAPGADPSDWTPGRIREFERETCDLIPGCNSLDDLDELWRGVKKSLAELGRFDKNARDRIVTKFSAKKAELLARAKQDMHPLEAG